MNWGGDPYIGWDQFDGICEDEGRDVCYGGFNNAPCQDGGCDNCWLGPREEVTDAWGTQYCKPILN